MPQSSFLAGGSRSNDRPAPDNSSPQDRKLPLAANLWNRLALGTILE
jgi:hypothetical protein